MRILRPLWTEGAFLSPQPFQQQAHWESDVNGSLAPLSLNHPWGVLCAEFDQDALRLNRLKAQHLRLRLPDGSWVDTDVMDNLPPAIDLAPILTGPQPSVEVLLALPLLHANGGNYLMMEEQAARPIGYRQEWATAQDLFGKAAESIALERLALTLRLASEEHGDYLSCPVARLVRDGQDNWAVDPQFVPPLLSFNAYKDSLNRLDSTLAASYVPGTLPDVQLELFAVLHS